MTTNKRVQQLEQALKDIIKHCNDNSGWLKTDTHGPYMGSFYYMIKDTAVDALKDQEQNFSRKEPPRCDKCGETLNADGTCPKLSFYISLSEKKRLERLHNARSRR